MTNMLPTDLPCSEKQKKRPPAQYWHALISNEFYLAEPSLHALISSDSFT